MRDDVVFTKYQQVVLPLSRLPVGKSGRILAMNGQGSVRRRLMDLGLTQNASVHVLGLAPMGDPMILFVRGFTLSIRKKQAGMIEVAVEEDA